MDTETLFSVLLPYLALILSLICAIWKRKEPKKFWTLVVGGAFFNTTIGIWGFVTRYNLMKSRIFQEDVRSNTGFFFSRLVFPLFSLSPFIWLWLPDTSKTQISGFAVKLHKPMHLGRQDSKYRNQNFWYDANGRMYKTARISLPNQSNSVYDALGNRVANQVDGVWSFYIYDINGVKTAEYGGLQATDEGGVKYILQDHQGSSRAMVNNAGYVNARMDYTAFGEEINSGIGGF